MAKEIEITEIEPGRRLDSFSQDRLIALEAFANLVLQLKFLTLKKLKYPEEIWRDHQIAQ